MIDKDEVFQFLDELRESGVTNMFGAASFIRTSFPNVDKKQSRELLSEWMETFAERQTTDG
tara:strand:+ start:3803 stop:3985 length:183 start_codon:yes stop_codon:yes gene_type:complete